MKEEMARELSTVLAKAREYSELQILLEGLLTPQELQEIGVRWQLMQELLNGRTQRDIAATLGISLGKIARGSRLLQYGSPEFRQLAERINKDLEHEQSK